MLEFPFVDFPCATWVAGGWVVRRRGSRASGGMSGWRPWKVELVDRAGRGGAVDVGVAAPRYCSFEGSGFVSCGRRGCLRCWPLACLCIWAHVMWCACRSFLPESPVTAPLIVVTDSSFLQWWMAGLLYFGMLSTSVGLVLDVLVFARFFTN